MENVFLFLLFQEHEAVMENQKKLFQSEEKFIKGKRFFQVESWSTKVKVQI
jgi:hypothetical protein